MKRSLVILVAAGALVAPLAMKAWMRIEEFVDFLDESENPYSKE